MTTQTQFATRCSQIMAAIAETTLAEHNGARPGQTAPLWAQIRSLAAGLKITLREEEIRSQIARRGGR